MEINQMKQKANQNYSQCTFQVSDMVFLRLHPYKQSSPKIKGHHKLAPKSYVSYKVLYKIGFVVYKFELRPSSCVHLIFHVSCLKNFIGTNINAHIVLLELDNQGSIILELESILNRHTGQLHSQSITEVLIQWHGMQPKDATWEPFLQIQQKIAHLKI